MKRKRRVAIYISISVSWGKNEIILLKHPQMLFGASLRAKIGKNRDIGKGLSAAMAA